MSEIEVTRDNTEVFASPGDRVVIRVPENPTTGFQWTVDHLSDELELESSEFVPSSRSAPGAGGERRVVLVARRGGRPQATLALKRQWEDRVSDQFDVSIVVR